MRARFLLTVGIVTGILSASSVAAQIVVIGQDRRASASAFVSAAGDFDQEQHSEVAPDAGPFDVTLLANAAIADGSSSADATQSSAIATTSVRAGGAVSAVAEVLTEEATAYGAAQSNVAIRFLLLQPAAYSLSGFLEGSGNTTVTVQLSRPFQTIAWSSATDEHVELGQEGELEPDTYDLNVTCAAVGSVFSPGAPQQGSAAYDVLLAFGQSTSAPVARPAGPAIRAFPNPFRESTRLEPLGTAADGGGELRVLDARGRLVRTLAASPSVLFDGRDSSGRALGSGVYWVKRVGLEDRKAVRLVLLR